MNRVIQVSALAFLSMFVFVEIAEARLIRSSGRGTLTLQTQQGFYFVKNEDIINFSEAPGISEATYNDLMSLGNSSNFNAIGGGAPGISAIPTSGGTGQADNCNGSYNQNEVSVIEDDIDFWSQSSDPNAPQELALAEAALDALINGSPCKWEITEGDDFTAFGNFNMYFDNPLINHTIEWNISGNGVNKTLSGSINEGAAINTLDGIIAPGQVMLEALWADLDLLPGEYEISVNAQVTSSAGQFFYERRNLGAENSFSNPVRLAEHVEENPAWTAWVNGPQTSPEPPFEIEGYIMKDDNGFGNGRSPSNSLSFDSRSSFLQNFSPEILVVLAGNNNPPPPPVAANAPATALFVVLGGIFAFVRKRGFKK